ncbi:MAG: restriction endonuclease, partial [Erysipelotrichaceae bacterium]|nr:restriction endonuclease [Erysipelotrichaceae bacterium]
MYSYAKSYVEKLVKRGQHDLALSIQNTISEFHSTFLDSFSFAEHQTGLLFGNVQAGKTAQMLGLICAATDFSFPLFIVLTTDNVKLQNQTYNRIANDLSDIGFCICDETDRQKFIDNGLIKPTIIVLKKNAKVLLQWHNTLVSSSFVLGNPLFIADDEADAASLNGKVNEGAVSTINKRLAKIKNLSVGSVYLQVTGTPQALLLQSMKSDFRPSFTIYFEPGKEYLGGEFFFGDDKTPICFIDDFDDDLKDGLYYAVIHHLVASAILFLNNENVCNFVIHPGVKKTSHMELASAVNLRLQYIQDRFAKDVMDDFEKMLSSMNPKKYTKHALTDVTGCILQLFAEDKIKVLIMNTDTNIAEEEYTKDANIIIGGNVLGRGITFPKLQTLYYTRTSKKPQADTIWQHARMFGYDRDSGMVSVYLTKELYRLFHIINEGNNSLVEQVEHNINDIQIFYPNGVNPTRKNVFDIKMVDLIAGGVNYFPSDLANSSVHDLDVLLTPFGAEEYYQVSLRMLLPILSHIEPTGYPQKAFVEIIQAMLAQNPRQQAI